MPRWYPACKHVREDGKGGRQGKRGKGGKLPYRTIDFDVFCLLSMLLQAIVVVCATALAVPRGRALVPPSPLARLFEAWLHACMHVRSRHRCKAEVKRHGTLLAVVPVAKGLVGGAVQHKE